MLLALFVLSGVEDETHRYWQCEHWHHVRMHHFGDNTVGICSQMQALSNAASICGIPTLGLPDFLVSQWLSICACMTDIHARANGHDSLTAGSTAILYLHVLCPD